jgi:hypothetical protein
MDAQSSYEGATESTMRDTPEIEPSAELLHKELAERIDYYGRLAEYHSAQANQHARARNACAAALETFQQTKADGPTPGF